MKEPLAPSAVSALIEDKLHRINLPAKPARLYEPMRYILQLGGKRLRPVLAIMSYNLFAEDIEPVILPALNIELFHNFSLIHDDIMDKAPVRRGQETIHIKWDNNVGILSGDGMLVKAYELLQDVPATQLPAVLKAFNQTAIEVCEGQQLDMDFEHRSLEVNPVTEAEYLEMIRLKTSVLFGYSLQLGALLAAQNDATANLLYDAGVHMGLAFQLQDDYLDLYGSDKFGKIKGGDIINAKKTFMLVKLLALATPADKESAIQILNQKSMAEEERITAIENFYSKYEIPKLVKNEIGRHMANFRKAIEQVAGERAIAIRKMVENLAERSY